MPCLCGLWKLVQSGATTIISLKSLAGETVYLREKSHIFSSMGSFSILYYMLYDRLSTCAHDTQNLSQKSSKLRMQK